MKVNFNSSPKMQSFGSKSCKGGTEKVVKAALNTLNQGQNVVVRNIEPTRTYPSTPVESSENTAMPIALNGLLYEPTGTYPSTSVDPISSDPENEEIEINSDYMTRRITSNDLSYSPLGISPSTSVDPNSSVPENEEIEESRNVQ